MNYLAVLALCFAFACGSSDPAVDADSGTTDVDAATALEVPANAGDMFAFLTDGDYLAFDAESAVHASAGPHGSGGVRTYLNSTLSASMAAANSEHPVGSAAIKELYASDGITVSGWAAAVKTAPGSGGATWYWYEVFSTTNGSNPIQGNNNPTCTGCHSSGADYIRIPFPLI